MSFETKSIIASFGGKLLKLAHDSKVLNCRMSLNLFLPKSATGGSTSASPSDPPTPLFNTPLIFYLAGLTCTGDNGAEKGGFHARAAQHGIAMCYPDTSPRGLKIEGEDKDYDFGTGAGFYVDATAEPWSRGYKMYSYITKELPEQLFAQFGELDPKRMSIMGHSMGGHGALTCVSDFVVADAYCSEATWNLADFLFHKSILKTQRNTAHVRRLRPLRIRQSAIGTKRHSQDTLEMTTRASGPSTTRQS